MAQPAITAITHSSRLRLWVPAAICLIALALELFFLFRGIEASRGLSQRGRTAKVAQLLSQKNQVRHKFGGTLIWDFLASGDDVFQGDAIATMEQAEAIVKLADESILVIEPDSLVVFETTPARDQDSRDRPIVAQIIRGSVTRKNSGKTPLLLKLSDAENAPLHRFEDISGNSIFRVAVQAYGIEVIVESGSVQMDQHPALQAGQRKELNLEEKLPAPQLKRPKIEIKREDEPSGAYHRLLESLSRLAMRLLTSSAFASESSEAKISVEFQWEMLKDAAAYQIQIAEDALFKKILIETRVTDAKYVFSATASSVPEVLYFRVAGFDHKGRVGNFSAVEKIEIRQQEKVSALAEPSPLPLVVPSPKPKTSPMPAPTLKPIPTPAPSLSPTPRPSPTPDVYVPKVFHAGLSLGALFHYRSLTGDHPPEKSSASGVVPARLRAELQEETLELSMGASYLMEKLTVTGLSRDQSVSVPLFRAWIARKRWGLYVTNRNEITFKTPGLKSAIKPLIGAIYQSAWIKNDQLIRSAEHRLQVAAVAIGTLGLDLTWNARVPVGKFFVGTEAQLRVMNVERSVGAALEVGYGF